MSTPEQLKHHQLLKYDNNAFNTITMTDERGNVFSGLPQVHASANNGDFLCELAISGMGIIQIPYFFVWQHLKDNKLERVLPDYQLPRYHAYAVYPQNRHLPRKVRTLIDFVEQQLKETPF